MTILWWILGGAVVTGFAALVRRQVRSGQGTPGAVTSVATGNHDEPLEDTARAVDQEHHHSSAGKDAEGYRDLRRSLGD